MKHPIIIATCAALLLSACDNSKTPEAVDVPKPSGTDAPTSQATSPMPTLAPGASTQERIDALKKRRELYLNAEPTLAPEPSPEEK